MAVITNKNLACAAFTHTQLAMAAAAAVVDAVAAPAVPKATPTKGKCHTQFCAKPRNKFLQCQESKCIGVLHNECIQQTKPQVDATTAAGHALCVYCFIATVNGAALPGLPQVGPILLPAVLHVGAGGAVAANT